MEIADEDNNNSSTQEDTETNENALEVGTLVDLVSEAGSSNTNKETSTQECLYVPITTGVLREFGLVEEFSHSISVQHKEQQENETKIWTTENTLFLIDIVGKFDKEFASGIKKNM
ncbi:hypothetical protein NQ314_016560 [Rhamnusium bicolor]|uniref:Uncharacterized protein n=1 Tax=Rhamnusium bicolor TaxID=1586634 RepID=A0AAV8WWN0_9CUCU|nr:hypothetical protein NQ314_016560 [Rhamnusium bicolor]